MRLKHDCMREVLLYLESVDQVTVDPLGDISISDISVEDIYRALPHWGKEDVYYSLFNLRQAGYISASSLRADDLLGELSVDYITIRGHEFLDSVRDDDRWGKIKKAGSAIRDYSLAAIASIAEGMTAGAVSAYLAKN